MIELSDDQQRILHKILDRELAWEKLPLEGPKKVVQVSLAEGVLSTIQLYAEQEGLSVSAACRRMIESFLRDDYQ